MIKQKKKKQIKLKLNFYKKKYKILKIYNFTRGNKQTAPRETVTDQIPHRNV